MSNSDIDRLAGLIWSSVKLRGTILLIAFLGLMTMWSSLEDGNKKALDTDKTICYALSQVLQVPNPQIYCVNVGIFSSRVINEQVRAGIAALPNAYRNSDVLKSMLEQYDRERRADYDTKLPFSFVGINSSLNINTLSLAKVAPFIALTVIAAVVILEFQERYYKREMTRLLKKAHQDELSLAWARSRFFVGVPYDHKEESGGRFPFGRIVGPSPESLFLAALYIGFIYSLVILLRGFSDNVVHLTDSVFFSYVFAFYAALFLTVWLLLNTRNAYRSQREPLDRRNGIANASSVLSLPWLRVTVAAVGLASFGLPWLMRLERDQSVRYIHVHAYLLSNGFHFLLHQTPLLDNNGHPILISPQTFGEIRIQLWFSILFLLICVLDSLGLPGRYRVFGSLLGKLCLWISLAILFLSVNYWVYMCVLWYQLTLGVPWPVVVPNFNGVSMINFAPAYGFWIFTGCCAFLIASSFRADRLATKEAPLETTLVVAENSEA